MTILSSLEHQLQIVKNWKEFLIVIPQPLNNYSTMKNPLCSSTVMFKMIKLQQSKYILAQHCFQGMKYIWGFHLWLGGREANFSMTSNWRPLAKFQVGSTSFFLCGGKEILIKAVVRVVSTYTMSVFKIPTSICDDIQRVIANFWWGSKSDKRSIHWSRWERLSQGKSKGGLGFTNFWSFN